MRTVKPQVAHRILLSCYTILLVYISFYEPSAMTYFIRATGGTPGVICLLVLLGLALLTLTDTVINDLFPDRYHLDAVWRYRQTLWMLMAITCAGIGFVLVRVTYSYGTATNLVLHGVWCAVIAFLDLKLDYDNALRNRRTTDGGLSA